MEASRPAVVGPAVRRYCRARLGPIRGLACADELAARVLAEVAADAAAPFDRAAYRAAARAVDAALTDGSTDGSTGGPTGAPTGGRADLPTRAARGPRRAAPASPGEPSSASAGSAGSSARLAAALEELPAPVRDVIVLRTFVGLSREEAAGALGVSDRIVLRRQQEAMRRLRLEEL